MCFPADTDRRWAWRYSTRGLLLDPFLMSVIIGEPRACSVLKPTALQAKEGVLVYGVIRLVTPLIYQLCTIRTIKDLILRYSIQNS